MDQIVDRPRTEALPSVESALGLNAKGSRKKRGRGWLYVLAAALVAAAGLAYMQLGGSSAEISYVTSPAKNRDITVAVSATRTPQPLTQVDNSSALACVMRS